MAAMSVLGVGEGVLTVDVRHTMEGHHADLAVPRLLCRPDEIIHANVWAAGDGGRHEQRWVDGWVVCEAAMARPIPPVLRSRRRSRHQSTSSSSTSTSTGTRLRRL